MSTAEEVLMTAEEFAAGPDDGRRTELVRGRIVEMPPASFLHCVICSEVAFALGSWIRPGELGRVVTNDSGIVTRRGPDSLRGADVAYYSFDRLPKGMKPQLYPEVAPELVVEVLSPGDRWPEVPAKVAEYLDAGVLVVVVLDPEPRSAHLYYSDRPHRMLGPGEELSFPEILPGFAVAVSSLSE